MLMLMLSLLPCVYSVLVAPVPVRFLTSVAASVSI